MKVLITDEQSLFRDGLSLRLKEINEDITILQSSSLIDMQKILSHETDTDLVILDIDLADINTSDVINKQKSAIPLCFRTGLATGTLIGLKVLAM